jgi:hypothetical protein
MQTLFFNTTTKEVTLFEGSIGKSNVLQSFSNISTVKCSELGFYEVMQKVGEESYGTIPVFRAPIANTNMRLEK